MRVLKLLIVVLIYRHREQEMNKLSVGKQDRRRQRL